jgi:hypothetical protein
MSSSNAVISRYVLPPCYPWPATVGFRFKGGKENEKEKGEGGKKKGKRRGKRKVSSK